MMGHQNLKTKLSSSSLFASTFSPSALSSLFLFYLSFSVFSLHLFLVPMWSCCHAPRLNCEVLCCWAELEKGSRPQEWCGKEPTAFPPSPKVSILVHLLLPLYAPCLLKGGHHTVSDCDLSVIRQTWGVWRSALIMMYDIAFIGSLPA